MSADQLAAGDPVIARGIDDESETVFVGNVIVPSGGSTFAYYRGENHNIPVYAVEDRTTGEVKFYRGDFLTFDHSD